MIFDAGPGELFVVRNVANLVPPYAPDGAVHGISAALEFAVQALRVKHIVVLGHARCGGIRAFVDKTAPLSPGDFIGKWMSCSRRWPRPSSSATHELVQEFVTRLEKAAIKRSLQNLMTFPCVSILVDRGKLQLHGAYFGVAEGSLAVLDQETGQFHAAS